MARFRDSLSPRARCWVGFGVCPLVTWLFAAISFWLITAFGNDVWRWLTLHSTSRVPISCFMVLVCGFCWSVITFVGFATAYFWKDVELSKLSQEMMAFYSVALTWAPALVWTILQYGDSYPLLITFPVFFFWCLFHTGLAWGHAFWDSLLARQFLGDFSEVERPSKN